MKSVLIILSLFALPALAQTFPVPKKVSCEILSEVNGNSQVDQSFEMDVAGLLSCQNKSEDFKVAGTELTLSASYSAACQRPNGVSYPEYINGPTLTGPIGSKVYARAFRLSGNYVKQSSLQMIATVNGQEYNVIAHCKLTP